MAREILAQTSADLPDTTPRHRSRSRFIFRNIARNRVGLCAAFVVAAMLLLAILSPILPVPDPLLQNLSVTLMPPQTPGHPLGTDQFGRDLLSRVLWGGRISIVMGVVASFVALGVGVPLGMMAGFLGGRLDSVIMRSTDMLLAFPYILLALVIVAVRGPGVTNALIAVAITNIPFYIRVTRGIVVTISHQPFVEAAMALGASTGRILRRVIFPAMVPYVTVAFTVSVGWLILEASALSFLGLGAQPPASEWGAMLGDSRNYLGIAPHVVVVPGLAISLFVISLNLAGEGLRGAMDVELRE